MCARAFARGRRSKSLYRCHVDDGMLEKTVGDVRSSLGMPAPDLRPTFSEVLAFGRWVLTAWLCCLAALASVIAPVAWIAWGLF